MKRKRFIAIGATALVMITGTGVAFGAVADASAIAPQKVVQQVTQVTITEPKISYPIQTKDVALSGPVKMSALSAGPIFSSDAPAIGSIDWLQQQEAEKLEIQAEAASTQEELESEIARLEKVADDTRKLNKALALTKTYVGKTWYALGGSTPSAWDCSGLVLWMYGHLDVTLYHSATVQKRSGELVDDPKIGDIVSFTHQGGSGAYHVGIVTGPDEMLHSGGKRGDRTEITSISRWAKGNANSEVAYTRILETNN